jgi:hypothetical protein
MTWRNGSHSFQLLTLTMVATAIGECMLFCPNIPVFVADAFRRSPRQTDVAALASLNNGRVAGPAIPLR